MIPSDPAHRAANAAPSEPVFRAMTPEDVPTVFAIERRSYAYHWSEGIFRDCLRVGYCCQVLARGPDILAYGIMSIAAGESHILNLCVRAGLRGQGLGRRMLMHLLEIARARRADTALLEVRPSNGPALHLYRTLGFNEIGVRRGYYPDAGGRREDALVLALALNFGFAHLRD